LDDAPLEERRARAVTLRQAVPHLAGGLGALDEAGIAEVARPAWAPGRDADQLRGGVLSLGVVPPATVETSAWTARAGDLGRARRATWAGSLLIAAERVATVRLALPRELGGIDFAPPVQEALFGRRAPETEEDALRAIVGGWLECVGPTTVAELAVRSGLPPSRVAVGLGRLAPAGPAVRG